MSGSTQRTGRAFVLGLDGVPWRLIEQWSDEGALPNFARLRDEGASGTLESTRPPTTPLAWPSIATGVWPDKHGIYGFQNLSRTYSHEMYTSHDVTQPTLWDLLSPAHVGNVPMTYPARELDEGGTMVTGMMTPSTDQDFTHPPDLQAEIESQVSDYEISLDYPEYADRLDDFEVAVDEMLANRRKVMDLQFDRAGADWRLFFFVYTAPDRFQHLIWDMDRLLDHYRKLDAILGDVIEFTDRHDADLYVVSDHGFGSIDQLVYINHVLEREGYLARREDEGTRGALASLGISRDRITDVLARVGISEELLVSTLPRTLVDSVAEQIPGDHALYDVNYEETTAFVHGAGNCYVNDTDRFEHGVVPPSEIDRVKTELAELFESVTDEHGDRVLTIADGDELFPTDDGSPDLVVNGVDGYDCRNAITDQLFGDTGTYAASHRSEGIILCRGPSIEPGATLRGARVVDVAPTLLHGIGEPVPKNIDGRVLFDAFDSAATPSQTKVERTAVSQPENEDEEAVDEDFTEVEDRLKGLGYME
ncbi:alkaline phosphatase family protein [Natrialba asiatica]|uniref:Type I phosphodiesterase/nucleotide pyrophosphatase n=1 Tax=Natrialba asiatica (strain ATCC 700177 / DSM 12278 / JCM 9576 / FERM P-10747 / NBRC 102637 / 172P1) TaxID=29540 RepID=M0ATA7_NATA1|nr:alkaline phosphatase family protein [Natrialba asiatica]ELZ00604.1 type I phosphodiesterase/nucleotide pyrophosphatase [Natrialba asiatica DSM 12278]